MRPPDPERCSEEFTYTPDEDFNGSDSFTYTATSDGSPSVAATVTITVDPVNDDPSFTDGGDVTVDEDSGSYSDDSFITDGSVGPADESASGRCPTPSRRMSPRCSQTEPAISPSGSLTFTPAANASREGSVSVKAVGQRGRASPAPSHFNITITSDNDAPSFTKGADILAPNQGETTRSGWATNVTDGGGESNTLTFEVTPGQLRRCSRAGPAVNASTGDLTFTPSGTRGTTCVEVRLGRRRDAVRVETPSRRSRSRSSTARSPTRSSSPSPRTRRGNPITLTGSDPEDDPLTFDIATPPAHGTLSGTGPNRVYTPNANFFGTDTFTYTATDGTETSPAATVTITVTSGNNDPVLAKNDAAAVKATVTTVLNPLANDSGGAGETLAGVTITAVTKPTKGSATITHGGTRVTYDPAACTPAATCSRTRSATARRRAPRASR